MCVILSKYVCHSVWVVLSVCPSASHSVRVSFCAFVIQCGSFCVCVCIIMSLHLIVCVFVVVFFVCVFLCVIVCLRTYSFECTLVRVSL